MVFPYRNLRTVLVLTLALLVVVSGSFSATPPPPVQACNTCNFLLTWGSHGSSDGQFSTPYGVAVDSSGNVTVADNGNNRVEKFTGTGIFITTWGTVGTGNGQFSGPWGVAVDSAGNVYVTDSNNNRVEKFTSTGTFITTWGSLGSGNGQFTGPFGVAVDSSGNVYVADSFNNRVEKFTGTGTYITKWGHSGTQNGNFTHPIGVAVDSSGNVYVTDGLNNRVQKFTSTGTFITKWGSAGSGNGQFSAPAGVAADSAGNVYVVDNGNNRVELFADVLTGSLTGWSLATISLVTGWNLISLPIVPVNTAIGSVLAGLFPAGNLTVVWSYQSYQGKPPKWESFIPGSACILNSATSLCSMADGFGYWIYMTSPGTLLVPGYTILPGPQGNPSTYSLLSGWNLVGFKPVNPSQNETVGAYLTTISGDYSIVGIYDNLNATWIQGNPNVQLASGEAMWIYMTTPATLVPPI